ncbi:MAG: hypothetical protein CEE43_03770 [Promethearchaeota archaeon Loki_b32]|nr:MAG: hypothetical protein CEE43_03770 [Candidatus Lokiarchaeota archaeon Loki_b32]
MSLSFEDLRTIISSGKKTEFAKAMGNVLTEKQNNLPDFYDFYGKLIKEDIIFTLSKCYIRFRKYAQRILSLDQLMEMDKILMENYALSKHEPIEYCFLGSIYRIGATWASSLFGVIYITKLRVIGLGIYHQSSGVRAIAKAVSSSIYDTSHKAFRHSMQKTLGDDFSEAELTKFDHFYPIINMYNIKKKKDIIVYTTKLEYEKKGKTKTIKLTIKLKPEKEKNEDKIAFTTKKEDLLNKIESFLLSYQ